MKDLSTKLEQARASFLKHSGTAPGASCMLILAWNNGAETMLRLTTEWSKAERLKLERIHNYESRRHD